MLALHKINNNAVICRDPRGRELVALGKGLGFGTLPREINLAEIDRTFYDMDSKYLPLLQELPSEIVELAAQVVDIARNQLPYELSPNLTVTLADHISFAIERTKRQLHIKMPLAYDVEQMYPQEYRIGCYLVRRVKNDFHVGLPDNEAVGIAMSLLNARILPDSPATPAEQSQTRQDDEMLEDITEIVEARFHIIVERSSFNYSRYATHLQYLFQRIHTGNAIDSDNLQLYVSMRDEQPAVSDCGVAVLTGQKMQIKKQTFLNPIVIATVVSALLFLTGLGSHLPSLLTSGIAGLAGLNAPLAMLVLGVYVAQADFRTLFSDKRLYLLSCVRLLLIPALSLLACRFLPLGTELSLSLIIAASAPAGANVAVYAQLHGLDYVYASKTVVTSTLLSAFTLPLVLLVAQTIL